MVPRYLLGFAALSPTYLLAAAFMVLGTLAVSLALQAGVLPAPGFVQF